jgi:lysophospholipase L1-like esterase
MLRKLLLLELALFVSIVLAEVALRLVDMPTNKWWVWQPNLRQTFQPECSIFPGVNGASTFTINPIGYRGDLFVPDSHNYLCLGGSTTECLYLDDGETWTSLLQQELNKNNPTQKVIIGNLGKSGVMAFDNYLHLKNYVPQLEDLKGVVFMVGLNDAMRFLKDSNNFDMGYNPEFEDDRAQEIFQRSVVRQKWWGKFKLTQLLHQVYHRFQNKKVDWMVQDTKGETLQRWRENRKSAVSFIDTLPPHEYALRNYEKVLHLILTEARLQSLEVYFVSQTSLYKDSMSAYEQSLLWMGGVCEFQQQAGHAYYTPRAIHQLLSEYNQLTADFCAKNNLPFVDLTRTLPKDTSVFYDDCDFNENGSRLVAKAITPLFSLQPNQP